jgi:hypothetical protein
MRFVDVYVVLCNNDKKLGSPFQFLLIKLSFVKTAPFAISHKKIFTL